MSPPPSSTRARKVRREYVTPSAEDIASLRRALDLWRRITDPAPYHVERVPSVEELERDGTAVVFVGNHTTYGILDGPLFWLLVYEWTGIMLSPLAHETHWTFDFGLGSQFEKYGAQQISPRRYYQLLRDGKAVLLYPGGVREVTKRKGEQYKLFWKAETDFVRPAVKFGSTIVPFSVLGPEDMYDLLLDADEVRSLIGPSAALAQLDVELEQRGSPPGAWFPIPTSPLPRPERIYILFGEPIRLKGQEDRVHDPAFCRDVYHRVRKSVEDGIDELKDVRSADPDSSFAVRVARSAVHTVAKGVVAAFAAVTTLQRSVRSSDLA